MQETPKKSPLGARTLEREVQRYLAWVSEHRPILAMREPGKLRRLIVQAINETRGIRVVVSVAVVPAIMAAGVIATNLWQRDSSSSVGIVVAALVCVGFATFLVYRWSEALVHKKIDSLANVTQ